MSVHQGSRREVIIEHCLRIADLREKLEEADTKLDQLLEGEPDEGIHTLVNSVRDSRKVYSNRAAAPKTVTKKKHRTREERVQDLVNVIKSSGSEGITISAAYSAYGISAKFTEECREELKKLKKEGFVEIHKTKMGSNTITRIYRVSPNNKKKKVSSKSKSRRRADGKAKIHRTYEERKEDLLKAVVEAGKSGAPWCRLNSAFGGVSKYYEAWDALLELKSEGMVHVVDGDKTEMWIATQKARRRMGVKESA